MKKYTIQDVAKTNDYSKFLIRFKDDKAKEDFIVLMKKEDTEFMGMM